MVFRAIREADQKTVLVKLPTFKDASWINQYWQEYRIWNQLSHPNLLQFEGLEVIESHPVLVLENFDGIPLKTVWIKSADHIAHCLKSAIAFINLLADLFQAEIDITDIRLESFLIHPDSNTLKLLHLGIPSPTTVHPARKPNQSSQLHQKIETLLSTWLNSAPIKPHGFRQLLESILNDSNVWQNPDLCTQDVIQKFQTELDRAQNIDQDNSPGNDWQRVCYGVTELHQNTSLAPLGHALLELFHRFTGAIGSMLLTREGHKTWQVQAILSPQEQADFHWPISTPLSQLPAWLQNIVIRVQRDGTVYSSSPSLDIDHYGCGYPLQFQDQLLGIIYLNYGLQAPPEAQDLIGITDFIANQGAIALHRYLPHALTPPPAPPQENEQRFRQLFQSTPQIAMQVYDKDHKVIEWNDASTSFYGYSREEALGQPLESLIIPEDMRPSVTEAIDAWITQDIPIPAGEIILQSKTGEPVHVFSSHFLAYNSHHDPELYCLDIALNQQKIAEESLRQSQQLLQLVLDTIPQEVFWKDCNGGYLGCNYRYAQTMGFNQSREMIGKTDQELQLDSQLCKKRWAIEKQPLITINRKKSCMNILSLRTAIDLVGSNPISFLFMMDRNK
ncbi:MAG: PAS domain S-box protein [Acaryochloridaceae cyanobacterium RL_2_7]|nr:PAS domain S-box protein [Acaryochloridaceae cyanobacterium RL_2_7]